MFPLLAAVGIKFINGRRYKFPNTKIFNNVEIWKKKNSEYVQNTKTITKNFLAKAWTRHL